jgi:2-keto-4-pentenoate hydratase/2-oxohepta-3-ene-1,7-dioic acid hydratase in catechol pathway
LDQVRLLAPCQPSKIVALGKNYAAHAREMAAKGMSSEVPSEPLIFLKPPSAVIGPGEAIVYPAMSQQVDYEAELVVVIGRRAKSVAQGEARSYVLGYTCGNDVTARDLQKKDGQWTRGKGFDTFCPLGPWIVTNPDPANLHLETRVNGVVRQSGVTSDLIFGVEVLVSHISQIMTLEPGDVIMTGTPAGVGPLVPGDVVEVEIEGIGVLRNPVVAGGESHGSAERRG